MLAMPRWKGQGSKHQAWQCCKTTQPVGICMLLCGTAVGNSLCLTSPQRKLCIFGHGITLVQYDHFELVAGVEGGCAGG
jgi:hypothetical protein